MHKLVDHLFRQIDAQTGKPAGVSFYGWGVMEMIVITFLPGP